MKITERIQMIKKTNKGMLKKTVYLVINVAPRAAIQTVKRQGIPSMRPLIATWVSLCQAASNPPRSFTTVCAVGAKIVFSGATYVQWDLIHVPLQRYRARPPPRTTCLFCPRCWKFAAHCLAGKIWQEQSATVTDFDRTVRFVVTDIQPKPCLTYRSAV